MTNNWRTFADALDELFLPYMAMTGNSFIPSAKKAFLLDLKYMENLFFIREVVWFVLFMVKLLVLLFSIGLFVLIVDMNPSEFYFGLTFPVVFVTLFSMLISFSTVGLYNHVEVAILVALCVDYDVHGIPHDDIAHTDLDKLQFEIANKEINHVKV
jgi:hypothetical protein